MAAESSGIEPIPFAPEDALPLNHLQMKKGLPTHKDPFDRILVCQAISQKMVLMTHDAKIPGFDVDCILEI